MSAKIERFVEPNTEQVYWHLKDDNGEIICQGEGHPSKESVQRAVNNVAYSFTKLVCAALGDTAALFFDQHIFVTDIPIEDV